jgi:ubiquinone/menaquinone biosynthesis C-methylase UbiE
MRNFGAVTARIYGWRRRNSPSNRIVVDLLELTPDDHALEVGCGPGAAVALAAGQIGPDRVAAVDPSPTFVTMVRGRVPGADVRVGSADDLPFDDGTFTVVWSIASMHHWPDREAGLVTQTAKLAAGGRLVVAERLLNAPGHGITAEQTAEVVTYLEQLGYTNVETMERPNERKTIQVIRAAGRTPHPTSLGTVI